MNRRFNNQIADGRILQHKSVIRLHRASVFLMICLPCPVIPVTVFASMAECVMILLTDRVAGCCYSRDGMVAASDVLLVEGDSVRNSAAGDQVSDALADDWNLAVVMGQPDHVLHSEVGVSVCEPLAADLVRLAMQQVPVGRHVLVDHVLLPLVVLLDAPADAPVVHDLVHDDDAAVGLEADLVAAQELELGSDVPAVLALHPSSSMDGPLFELKSCYPGA